MGMDMGLANPAGKVEDDARVLKENVRGQRPEARSEAKKKKKTAPEQKKTRRTPLEDVRQEQVLREERNGEEEPAHAGPDQDGEVAVFRDRRHREVLSQPDGRGAAVAEAVVARREFLGRGAHGRFELVDRFERFEGLSEGLNCGLTDSRGKGSAAGPRQPELASRGLVGFFGPRPRRSDGVRVGRGLRDVARHVDRPLQRFGKLLPEVDGEQSRDDSQAELDAPDVVEVRDVLQDQVLERRGGADGDDRCKEDPDPLHGEDGGDERAAVPRCGELGGDGGGELWSVGNRVKGRRSGLFRVSARARVRKHSPPHNLSCPFFQNLNSPRIPLRYQFPA